MNENVVAKATSLVQLGRYQEAVDMAREALAAEPDRPDLLRVYAIALAKTGDSDAAVEPARRAVALEPEIAISYRTLGIVLTQTRTGLKEGLDALDEARRRNPNDPLVHQLIAEQSLKLIPPGVPWNTSAHLRSVLESARAASKEARRLAPQDPVGHIVHAKVLLSMNDLGAAEMAARHGLRLDPDHHVGHQLLGIIAAHRGDTGSAGDYFVSAARANPRSGLNLRLLKRVPGVWLAWLFAGFLLVGLINEVLRGQMEVTLGGVIGWVIVLFLIVFVPYYRVRRHYSEEAKAVLRRDRSMRFRKL
jgi:tetratricopeptide (TPR) repeat protein